MDVKFKQANRRREPRWAINVRAAIRAKRDAREIECRVHNISVSGARISVLGEEIPNEFMLCLTRRATVTRVCRVVWRDGSEAGVKFILKRIKAPSIVPI